MKFEIKNCNFIFFEENDLNKHINEQNTNHISQLSQVVIQNVQFVNDIRSKATETVNSFLVDNETNIMNRAC